MELGRLQASGEGRGGVTRDAPADWERPPPCGLGAGSGRWLGRKKMQLDTL